MDQIFRSAIKENRLANLLDASQRHTSDAAGDPVEGYAEGSLPSDHVGEAHGVPPSGSQTSAIGGLLTSAKSLASNNPIALVGDAASAAASGATLATKSVAGMGLATIQSIESSTTNRIVLVSNIANTTATSATTTAKSVARAGLETIESSAAKPIALANNVANSAATSVTTAANSVKQTARAIESSAVNSVTLVGNVARTTVTGATQAVENRALALVFDKLRAAIFYYVAKLPIVGIYFKRDSGSTEATPLLGMFRGSGNSAAPGAEGLLCRLLGGRLLINLQEQLLVVAPTVALGHLSTTALAASTLGTAVASVTGYSIIQGFVSSLDKVLASAPNRHVAMMACTQVAVMISILLFPISTLWVVQSATLLQRLGQAPEITGLASEFLRVAAAGLPGYAISEIAKRYLASRGLSGVHSRVLAIITPLNLILNYLLVRGPIPTLHFGFIGAPLCTVLSYNTLALVLTLYIVQRAIRGVAEQGQPTSNQLEVTSPSLRTLISAGLSGVLKNASQVWSKDLGGVIASMLGPQALATQAVVLVTATTLYQVPKATNDASSKRVGMWISKNKVHRAKAAASAAFVTTLGGALVANAILLWFGPSWGALFSTDPVIVQSVTALLPIITAFHIVHGLGAWVDGALGSLGKSAMFPSLNASADYLLGIPLGAYLAIQRQWGLAGVWVGLTVSLTCSWVVATLVLLRTHWRNAARARRENAAGAEHEASIGSRTVSGYA